MQLSGQQRKKLQEALIDAFPTSASLEQMLSFELDKNLRVIVCEGSLQDIVFILIRTAKSEGWVEDLVRAARKSNPGNALLKAAAQEYSVAAEVNATAEEIERTFKFEVKADHQEEHKIKNQSTIDSYTKKAINKNTLQLQNQQHDLNVEINKEVTGQLNLKPSVQKYRFEYAEVELKLSGLFGFGRKPIITSRRKGASYFVEDLGSGVELEMIAIPNGHFYMGSLEVRNASSSEFPQHQVSVNSFFMGKYPITQKQWKAVACLPQINRSLVVNCSKFKGDSYPVEHVCWCDAIEFCDRLSQYTGKTYRLPSEAEWEYACRAGTTTLFHFGDIITSNLANYNYKEGSTSSRGVLHHQTTPVDNFKFANAFGLYDMHGNIWEWCMDHWHDNYNKSPNDGTVWLNNKDSQLRVIRGGSWADIQDNCRSASRKSASINERGNYLGFRVVCF